MQIGILGSEEEYEVERCDSTSVKPRCTVASTRGRGLVVRALYIQRLRVQKHAHDKQENETSEWEDGAALGACEGACNDVSDKEIWEVWMEMRATM